MQLRGRDYEASAPRLLTRAEAGPLIREAFSPLERASLRALGITQFMWLQTR